MSKQVKKVVTTTSANRQRPATTASSRTAKKKSSGPVFGKHPVIFGKENMMIMAGGVVLIGLGLALMTGGRMPDPNTWDPKIIYSSRITVLAPVLILAGLGIQVLAIFRRKKEGDLNESV